MITDPRFADLKRFWRDTNPHRPRFPWYEYEFEGPTPLDDSQNDEEALLLSIWRFHEQFDWDDLVVEPGIGIVAIKFSDEEKERLHRAFLQEDQAHDRLMAAYFNGY